MMATIIMVLSFSFDLTFTPVRSDRQIYLSKYTITILGLLRMGFFGLYPLRRTSYKLTQAQVRLRSVW